MDFYPIKNYGATKLEDGLASCPTNQHKSIWPDYELNSLSNDTKYIVLTEIEPW